MKRILLCALLGASAPVLAQSANNPLLQPWPGPAGGLIPFDKIRPADFIPAFKAGRDRYREEINAIVGRNEAATFANTIAAFESAGETLKSLRGAYDTFSASLNDRDFARVEAVLGKAATELGTEIGQNERLFARVREVHDHATDLGVEEKRLTQLLFENFVKEGALLPREQKVKLAKINTELTSLLTRSRTNITEDQAEPILISKTQPELVAGISASALAAHDGGNAWSFTGSRMDYDAVMSEASNREFRKRLFDAYTTSGERGGARDNHALIAKVIDLRRERARLLGADSYADWRLSSMMSKTPERVLRALDPIWQAAKTAFNKQLEEMRPLAARDGIAQIEAWDVPYYLERLRQAKYEVRADDVKPYLQIDNIVKAMFLMAKKLYGLEFEKVANAPAYNDAMVTYLVKRADGSELGVWIFDPFAVTKIKRGGAWMLSLRAQGRRDGHAILPIVSNNSNIQKPAPGEAATMTLEDARTAFHEFGHGLHGLLSDVNFPMLSGPSGASAALAGFDVVTDFVELHSQFHEHFLQEPEMLALLVNAAGERIPPALLAKIEASSNFDQPYRKLEQIASTYLDLYLHMAPETNIDLSAFEDSVFHKIGMPKEMIARHRLPYFAHMLYGDEYASCYSAYILSEVLTYDVTDIFSATGNAFDPAKAEALRREIFAIGNSVDATEAYLNFAGREPDCSALLRGKGLIDADAG